MERPVRYVKNGDKILKVTEDGLRINVYPSSGKVIVQQPKQFHADYVKGLKSNK